MGSQTKYGKKELVYVNISVQDGVGSDETLEKFKYGFFTNIPETSQIILGHIKIPQVSYMNPPNKLVIGCSFPKPRRASIREGTRHTSSYVAQDKILSAKKLGYRISTTKVKNRLILPGSDTFVQTAYVVVNGIKYGWNLPKVTETNVGDLTGLGVLKPSINEKNEICFGATYPKPARASKSIVRADDVKTISTFYDPLKIDLPAGWTPTAKAKLHI